MLVYDFLPSPSSCVCIFQTALRRRNSPKCNAWITLWMTRIKSSELYHKIMCTNSKYWVSFIFNNLPTSSFKNRIPSHFSYPFTIMQYYVQHRKNSEKGKINFAFNVCFHKYFYETCILHKLFKLLDHLSLRRTHTAHGNSSMTHCSKYSKRINFSKKNLHTFLLPSHL